MTFVTPLLLGGAALVAVPIVLHLVMRQKPRQMEFPALRFIKKREETNRRQLRLRHLLLLLLRCAAIALLALALARPSIQSTSLLADQEAPVAAALLFDSSPRMQYRHENQTRLEVAQDTGTWLLSQLPRESEVAVIDSGTLTPVFAVDLGAAGQRIERLSVSPAARPLLQLFSEALLLLRDSEKPRKEVYVFTDLATSAWTDQGGSELQRMLGEVPGVAVYIIDVGIVEPRNFSLGDLKLSAEKLAQGGSLHVATQLISTGFDEERTVALYLLRGDSPQKRSQHIVEGSAGSIQNVEFELSGLESGTNHGYLQIQGADGLGADDMRYFTVDVRPSARVLVAAPRPAERNSRFLTQALAPESFRKARFQCEVVDLESLRDLDLSQFAAVCLDDPTPLPAAVWDQLHAYVQRGGGLAIWIGPNAQPMDEFNHAAALELLPAALKRQWSNRTERLKPSHFDHPILSVFRGGEVTTWHAPVLKYWQLEDLDEGANVVLAYSGGHPALIEQAIGNGRVLTMTTRVTDEASAEDAWNALLTHWDPSYFVVLNEMIGYLSGTERLNYFVGDTAVLRLDRSNAESVFTMTTPRNDNIQQTVDTRQNTITVTATDTPGHYTLTAGGEGGIRRGFSVNLTAESTRLARASEDDLKTLFGETSFRIARGRETLVREIGEARIGQELFPYLIVIVALILAAEHVLANRFYRNKSASARGASPARVAPAT